MSSTSTSVGERRLHSATIQPRILMLSIVNPKVESNGASTVTRGLLKVLALPAFQAQVECIPVRSGPVRWHRLAQAASLLRGVLSNLPAKAAFLYSNGFREKVVALLRNGHYDLIIINGADLLWIADSLPKSTPRILVAHNIEHRLFRFQIQHLEGWFWPLKWLLRADCKRLEMFELTGMRETHNVIFLSREEAIDAKAVCEGLHSTTLPPVFDYPPSIRQPRKPGPILEIGMIGNFEWWPNQLSLKWFAVEVLPYVTSQIRLNLFGPPQGRGRRHDRRIVERGVVDDIQKIWDHCDFMICPTFPTGGVCVKFAEAVYNRVPVLATTHAARGLPIEPDAALVFLDEPEEWIDFLNSHKARQLAERQPSNQMSAQFSIDTHKDALQQFAGAAIRRCGSSR